MKLKLFSGILLTALIVLQLLIFFKSGKGYFYLELFEQANHLKLYTVIFVGIIALIQRDLLAVIFCSLGIALLLFVIFEASLNHKPQNPPSTERSQSYSLIQYNIWIKNKQPHTITPKIKRLDPDFLLIEELRKSDYAQFLQTLDYPYQYPPLKKSRPQGSVIFSRYPIQLVSNQLEKFKFIHYTITTNPEINIIQVHFTSPKTKYRIIRRNTEIEGLAQYLIDNKSTLKNLIIAGDFNSAPWQHSLKKMQRTTGVKTNIAVSLKNGTWPSWLPPWVRVPIDSFYYTDSVENVKSKVIDLVGSDHNAVFTRFEIF